MYRGKSFLPSVRNNISSTSYFIRFSCIAHHRHCFFLISPRPDFFNSQPHPHHSFLLYTDLVNLHSPSRSLTPAVSVGHLINFHTKLFLRSHVCKSGLFDRQRGVPGPGHHLWLLSQPRSELLLRHSIRHCVCCPIRSRHQMEDMDIHDCIDFGLHRRMHRCCHLSPSSQKLN